MKKNYNMLFWGLVLIAVGILTILDIKNVITFKLLEYIFPVILILIGINTIMNSKTNIFGYIFIVLGVFIILKKAIDFKFDFLYLIPIVLILVGTVFIVNMFSKNNGIKPSGNVFMLFSGREDKTVDVDFKGSNITCIFGGYELDLREHNFIGDMTFNVITIFGGADITVPENVNIVVRPTAVFGGVDNVTTNKKDNQYTVYINAFCLFGGLDVNNYRKQK